MTSHFRGEPGLQQQEKSDNLIIQNACPSALVIGAGLSGLKAARALKAQNVDVTILEGRDRVAEPWRARHPQLRLNDHRRFAERPGLAMTRDDGAFVRRDTLINYLEDFADMIDVPIRFGTAVQSIGQTEHGWKLETDKGALEAMHVIVTTGREKIPHVPDWPGRSDFDGDILHVADLGDIGRFSRRRILVIGAGNSGSDVLNHLAGIDTADVWISLRHGPAIIPARLFGFPMHRLARLFEQVPGRLLDRMLSLTQRLVFGDLSQFGFRSHPVGGGTRLWRDGILPAIDSGFVAAVKQGRMRIVGETVRFDRCSVHFAEGTSIEREIVISATGYRSGLEPLFGRLKVLDGEGHPWRGLGEPDPHHRALWFTGYKAVFPGYFHAAKIAAQRIAQGVVNGTGEVVGARQTPSRHSRPVHSLAVST